MTKVGLCRLWVAAVLLPSAIVVLAAVGLLLNGLGDTTGGRWLYRLALAGGIAWILVLLSMLYAAVAAQLGFGRRFECSDLEPEARDEELSE